MLGSIGAPEFAILVGVLLAVVIVGRLPARPRGIGLTVLGAALGIWAFTRITSVAGQFFTWTPPFSQYETITLGGGGLAAVLLIWGLISLTSSLQLPNPTATTVGAAPQGAPGAISASFCTNCGGSLAPEDAFCGKCGRPRAGPITSAV